MDHKLDQLMKMVSKISLQQSESLTEKIKIISENSDNNTNITNNNNNNFSTKEKLDLKSSEVDLNNLNLKSRKINYIKVPSEGILPFFEEGGKLSVIRWLEIFESLARLRGWNEEEKIEVFKLRLSESAMNWFFNLKKENLRFITIKQHMIERFNSKLKADEAMLNMYQIKMEPTETFDKFVIRFYKSLELYQGNLDDTVKKTLFVNSLTGELKSEMLKI